MIRANLMGFIILESAKLVKHHDLFKPLTNVVLCYYPLKSQRRDKEQ